MTKFKQQCLRGTEIMEINYEKPDAGEAPRLTKIKKKNIFEKKNRKKKKTSNKVE